MTDRSPIPSTLTSRAEHVFPTLTAEPGERWLYCYPDDAFVEY